jgi:hypothetical protein
LFVERVAALDIFVFWKGQFAFDGENVRGAEARVEIADVHEAAHHQRSAGKQDYYRPPAA